jgi:hypothetical protein
MRYLVVLMLIAGCATTQRYWEKPGASVQEFNADSGQCNAQAFGVPGAMYNQIQVAVVYNQCMQGRGWYVVQK